MRAASGRAEPAPGAIAQMKRRVGIAKNPRLSAVPGWRKRVNRALTLGNSDGLYVADGWPARKGAACGCDAPSAHAKYAG